MVKKLLPSLTVFALYVAFILGSTTLADKLETGNHELKSSNDVAEDKETVEKIAESVIEEIAENNVVNESTELSLLVFDSNVRVFCFSSTKENSLEIIELCPTPSGKYEIRVKDAKVMNNTKK